MGPLSSYRARKGVSSERSPGQSGLLAFRLIVSSSQLMEDPSLCVDRLRVYASLSESVAATVALAKASR
jgi:hypothetical protein